MPKEEKEYKIQLKCTKKDCMRPFKYGGLNIFRATCPWCGQKVYLSKARINKHEYDKRLNLWKEALENYKKELEKLNLK